METMVLKVIVSQEIMDVFFACDGKYFNMTKIKQAPQRYHSLGTDEQTVVIR